MKRFSLEKIVDYRMFHVVKSVNQDTQNIALFHQNFNTRTFVDPSKYEVFAVGDSDILIAFSQLFEHVGKYNYIAVIDGLEYYVGLQPFERIVDFLDIEDDDPDNGVFVFLDSRPAVMDDQNWRCDYTLYGPRLFRPLTENDDPFFQDGSSIKIWEPIIGVNGIGHITYIKLQNDTEVRKLFVDNAVLPLSAATLPEMFKLIQEWSSVVGDPFNNVEAIAHKAKLFVDYFGIDESYTPFHHDMQVYNYLKGHSMARLRPGGSSPMSEKLTNFVMSNISYMTFSKLVQLNPSYFDLSECIAAEFSALPEEWNRSLEFFRIDEDFAYGNVDDVLKYVSEYLPGALGFAQNNFALLAKKRQLLDNIRRQV